MWTQDHKELVLYVNYTCKYNYKSTQRMLFLETMNGSIVVLTFAKLIGYFVSIHVSSIFFVRSRLFDVSAASWWSLDFKGNWLESPRFFTPTANALSLSRRTSLELRLGNRLGSVFFVSNLGCTWCLFSLIQKAVTSHSPWWVNLDRLRQALDSSFAVTRLLGITNDDEEQTWPAPWGVALCAIFTSLIYCSRVFALSALCARW